MKKVYFIDEANGINEETTEALMHHKDEVYSINEVSKAFNFDCKDDVEYLEIINYLPHYEVVNEIDEDEYSIEEIYIPLSSLKKQVNYLSEEEIRKRLEEKDK